LTARTFGAHGIAVSIAASDPWEWDTAVAVARSAVEWMLRQSGPRRVLNVNVPALPLDRVRGVQWADMDEFGHFRVAIADLPGEKLQFEMSGTERDVDPTSDTAICRSGSVSLTLLSSLDPAPFPAEPATAVWSPVGENADSRSGANG
jgi:5'-nucleotidase